MTTGKTDNKPAPRVHFHPSTSMTEYLNTTELHQLTGYARKTQQAEWLKGQCIPHKVDGTRVIVSRVHVQRWLEGKHTVSSQGPNWAKIA